MTSLLLDRQGLDELPALPRLLALPEELAGLTALDKLDLRWNRGLDVPWLEQLERRGCVLWR